MPAPSRYGSTDHDKPLPLSYRRSRFGRSTHWTWRCVVDRVLFRNPIFNILDSVTSQATDLSAFRALILAGPISQRSGCDPDMVRSILRGQPLAIERDLDLWFWFLRLHPSTPLCESALPDRSLKGGVRYSDRKSRRLLGYI